VFSHKKPYNTNCILKYAESGFKNLQWLMLIHNQSALRSGTNLKRILISNRYNLPAKAFNQK